MSTGKAPHLIQALFNLGKPFYIYMLFIRDDIIKAMDSYLNRQFRKGTTEYSVYSQPDGSEFRIEISCHNLNFKSFWGGEWLSSWIVNLQTGHISGNIKVHNHYFEQGNIQFNMAKEIQSTKLSA